MEVVHLNANASSEELHEIMLRDGCVVIDNLIPAETVAAIQNEMAPFVEATPYGADDFDGLQTRRTGSLVARSPSSHEIIMDPLVLGVADKALAHATNYQLHCTQMIEIGPGSPAQVIHRDQWAFDMFPFPAGFDSTFSTMWALTDFSAENGATRVIPGSHKFEDKLRLGLEETIPAEMTAGSVLLYTGSTYHGGGPNTSDQVRMGLIIHYSLAWLRQEENQYLGVPQEVLDTLPEDLLRLMGYQNAAFSLGFIDGGVDSMAAVRPDLVRENPRMSIQGGAEQLK